MIVISETDLFITYNNYISRCSVITCMEKLLFALQKIKLNNKLNIIPMNKLKFGWGGARHWCRNKKHKPSEVRSSCHMHKVGLFWYHKQQAGTNKRQRVSLSACFKQNYCMQFVVIDCFISDWAVVFDVAHRGITDFH